MIQYPRRTNEPVNFRYRPIYRIGEQYAAAGRNVTLGCYRIRITVRTTGHRGIAARAAKSSQASGAPRDTRAIFE